jgi:peroxidase
LQLGGPTWTVPLGRRDSTNANLSQANSDLPPPFANISGLIAGFAKKGFTAREMTALSGAHTIGFAQCKNYRDRIYNDTNIDPVFATNLKSTCASAAPGTDAKLAPFDKQTDLVFDNKFYDNLANRQGLIHSDQELYNPGGTQSQASVVSQYRSNSNTFFNEFAAAMVKMGNIAPLTGAAGQIRLNCRVVNS